MRRFNALLGLLFGAVVMYTMAPLLPITGPVPVLAGLALILFCTGDMIRIIDEENNGPTEEDE